MKVLAAMQSTVVVLALTLCTTTTSGASIKQPRGATPVKLIIDTDIGGGGCNDVDDVVAVCIANALTDNGEVSESYTTLS